MATLYVERERTFDDLAEDAAVGSFSVVSMKFRAVGRRTLRETLWLRRIVCRRGVDGVKSMSPEDEVELTLEWHKHTAGCSRQPERDSSRDSSPAAVKSPPRARK
jgi:hypothetical protein